MGSLWSTSVHNVRQIGTGNSNGWGPSGPPGKKNEENASQRGPSLFSLELEFLIAQSVPLAKGLYTHHFIVNDSWNKTCRHSFVHSVIYSFMQLTSKDLSPYEMPGNEYSRQGITGLRKTIWSLQKWRLKPVEMIQSKWEHSVMEGQTLENSLLLGDLLHNVKLVKSGIMNRLYQDGENWLGRKDPRHRMCGSVLSCFGCVWLFATLRTVACQAPLSMGLSRQKYWIRLPCPPPEDLPDPGIKLASAALALPLSHRESPKHRRHVYKVLDSVVENWKPEKS